MKPFKRSFKNGLAQAWMRLPGPLRASSTGVRAAVLNYHSVSPDPNPNGAGITPERFEEHILFLRSHFAVLPLADIVAAILDNEPLPAGAVAVTFDDGYEDNCSRAWPILKRHLCPATFFLATGYLDGEVDFFPNSAWGPLRWDQVREMAADDLATFGAHSHSHASLGGLSRENATAEIKTSKARIESELGRAVDLFAYPNGQGWDIGEAAIDAVRDLGFKAAFSTFWGTRHRASERFRLRRVRVDSDDDTATLSAKAKGAYDFIGMIHRARGFAHWALNGRGSW